MPETKSNITEVKVSSKIREKIDVLFLLLTVGVIGGSFFFAVIVINSAVLTRR